MNLKSIVHGLALLVPMALATQAATPTILDWQFNTSANPSEPDGSATVNNTGGAASISISGTATHYYFGLAPVGGTRRGSWDTINGAFAMSIQAGTTSPGEVLNYTLTIDQFFDSATGLYPGTMQFSIGTPASSSRSVLEDTAFGQWVEDTFTWNITPAAMLTPLALTITPDPSGDGELFFDRVRWDIVGDIAVPEPHAQAIAALGLLAFGVRSWFRRKA